MLVWINNCKYGKLKCDMYGNSKLKCTNPNRRRLSNIVLRLLHLNSNNCLASLGFERYCPLYENLIEPPPAPPLSKL